MNDTDFRKNCGSLASDIIAEHINRIIHLDVPEDWQDELTDTSNLSTAALLYMASKMPILTKENHDKEPCAFCDNSSDAFKMDSSYKLFNSGINEICIDIKAKKIILRRPEFFSNDEKQNSPHYTIFGSFPIAYCLVCGRKL